MAENLEPRAQPESGPVDRCPSCGGPVERFQGLLEALCERCGIYVEFLQAPPPETPEPVAEAPGVNPELSESFRSEDVLGDAEAKSATGSAPPSEATSEPAAGPSPEPERAEAPAPAPPLPEAQKVLPSPSASPPALGPGPAEGPSAPPTPSPEIPEGPPTEPPGVPPSPAPPVHPPAVPEDAVAPQGTSGTDAGAPTPEPPPLLRWQIVKATKAVLVDLAAAHGLETSGTKREIRERLLGKLDRAPEPQVERLPAEPEVRESTSDAIPAVPPEEVRAEPPETEPASPVPLAAEAEIAPEAPPPEVEIEAVPEEVPPPPEPTAVEVAELAIETVVPASVAIPSAASTVAPARRKPPRADRFTFYLGAAEVAFGGSFLLLGSLFHDLFRVPVIGTSYGAFGGVNVLFAFLGALFLAAGAGAMAVGAKRGSRKRTRATGG